MTNNCGGMPFSEEDQELFSKEIISRLNNK